MSSQIQCAPLLSAMRHVSKRPQSEDTTQIEKDMRALYKKDKVKFYERMEALENKFEITRQASFKKRQEIRGKTNPRGRGKTEDDESEGPLNPSKCEALISKLLDQLVGKRKRPEKAEVPDVSGDD